MPPQAKKTTAAVETVEAPVLGDEPVELAPETVMVDHPQYGLVSLTDLEQILRAEFEAEAVRRKDEAAAQEAAKLPEICVEHFPEGWDSKNAAGQDGVGCEHGSWTRTRVKE